MVKVFSSWNPPEVDCEHSDKPSLTDELACEDLTTVVERFLRAPYVPGKVHYDYEGDEQGALSKLDDPANVDVAQLDNVDCLEILAGAERLASQLRTLSKQETKKIEQKQEKKPEVVQDVAENPENAK